jgi:hypothetical protein
MCRRVLSVACVDYAETVAFGIGEDHIVSISGSLLPVHRGRPESNESMHLISLIVGVEIEMDTGWELHF